VPGSEDDGSERRLTPRALIRCGCQSQRTKHWTGSRFELRLELEPDRSRKLLLKDTGRKLAHIEKQLRTGHSISTGLTERLKEQSL